MTSSGTQTTQQAQESQKETLEANALNAALGAQISTCLVLGPPPVGPNFQSAGSTPGRGVVLERGYSSPGALLHHTPRTPIWPLASSARRNCSKPRGKPLPCIILDFSGHKTHTLATVACRNGNIQLSTPLSCWKLGNRASTPMRVVPFPFAVS